VQEGSRRPVPLRFVLKCKRHPDGTYDKHRARLVICGHKGFMTWHEYKDTFAAIYMASPDIETSRLGLVQVLALISGWSRLAFGISVAYLQSAADSTFEVPVMYGCMLIWKGWPGYVHGQGGRKVDALGPPLVLHQSCHPLEVYLG
jgi:hypothetical protein